MNRAFVKTVRTGLPYVTVKMAMTLDGKVATRNGDSKWVGGKEELLMVQRLRNQVGAVMAGAGTVIKDNPRLTCRLPGGRDPLRVIVDGKLAIAMTAKVLKDKNVVLVTGPRHNQAKAKQLAKRGINHVIAPLRSGGRVKLEFALRHLAARGINHVMCEGGPELNASLLDENLADEVLLAIAPKLVGSRMAPGPVGGMGIAKMGKARKVRIVSVLPLGEDWMIRAKLAGL